MEPEDLVQSALALLLEERIEWRGSLDQLLRSLSTTIYNLSRDTLKRERKRDPRALDEHLFLTEPNSSDRFGVADHILLVRDEEAALEKLPSRMRATVKSYWMEDNTAKEVARDLGITEPTVRNCLSRARPRLREDLECHRTGPT